ncbi:hypothetical protein LWI29_002758 [Acer saccharum]|uniref:SOSEKI DIX-like domain-containing protein n=1 Tax=Acer saccharum TaxID=4024 RepID=A0AA39RGH8_ACESA|nr:hypothetical protein LWI29_002758 [Acer saccharum]
MELRDDSTFRRRRRRMEGVVKVNGGVGEVRRVHIIYLLSRMGRIEHPHLLRVHHLTRNGVYLRDVKRWLAEVRGQDFPEAFSWSYKRRYKNGYLWQDLLDDDLITPISDNEYVLKGSQYHNPAASHNGGINHHEKKTCVLRNDVEEQPSQSQMESEILALKLNTSSEIGQDSPVLNGSDTSTLTHDSTQHTSKQTTSQQNDTNDAVLVTVNRADKTTPTSTDKLDCRAVINRDGDKLGGSCRVFGSPWNNQHHQQHRARRSFDGSRSSSKKKQYEFGSPKPASDVYKPVGGPTCSQCGKSFKPEKLHAHMKSCKGMKALTRSASLSLRKTPSQRSCNSTHEESISAYFLTN